MWKPKTPVGLPDWAALERLMDTNEHECFHNSCLLVSIRGSVGFIEPQSCWSSPV